MTDIFNKEKRSFVMSKVRSNGNKSTELALISIFKELGITGWRRGSKLNGKPDFIFPKLKIAVFVDGCFWHGHDCRNTKPQANSNYWIPKIQRNMERDKEVSKNLEAHGWRVIRIWECELKKKNRDLLVKKLISITNNKKSSGRIWRTLFRFIQSLKQMGKQA